MAKELITIKGTKKVWFFISIPKKEPLKKFIKH